MHDDKTTAPDPISGESGKARRTMRTIRIGGPFSIVCPKCKAPRQDPCRARNGRKRGPHTKRRDAALTYETTAREGDLVIVALSSGRDREREALAHLKTIGDETAIVRVWRPGPQAFASPRLVALRDIVRRAPELEVEEMIANGEAPAIRRLRERLDAEADKIPKSERRRSLSSSRCS